MTRSRKRQKEPKQVASHTVVVTGVHPVRVLLKLGRVKEVWIRQGASEARLDDLITEAKLQDIYVIQQSPKEFDARVATDTNHQNILALASPQDVEPENALPIVLEGQQNPLILVLDGITDPHNFGACLRSAEAFGATCVVVPKDNSAPLNHVVRKTSSGASELIPVVRVTNLARCLRKLQEDGFWVVGAAGESTIGLDVALNDRPIALVMGSEGKGLRRLTREICDVLVAIPMAGLIESLNVSVAAGILLYNWQFRRGILDTSRSHEERV